MVDHGIKPAYVFDGKPPELKGGVVSLPYVTYTEVAKLICESAFIGRIACQTFCCS